MMLSCSLIGLCFFMLAFVASAWHTGELREIRAINVERHFFIDIYFPLLKLLSRQWIIF